MNERVRGSGEYLDLSSRERQIMEILFRRGRATVAEIREDLTEPPTAAAVRTMLARLEAKGHLVRKADGPRNLYSPTVATENARRSTLRRVMRTFFQDSPLRTVAAILEEAEGDLADDELDRLAGMIEAARRKGR